MIYLDNAATTKPLPQVLDIMRQTAEDPFGNPSSLHAAGIAAEKLVSDARKTIAATLGALPEEILFGPSGSFMNNLAVIGGAKAVGRRPKKVVTTVAEHASVRESVKALEDMGMEVCFCDPTASSIADAVDENTVLVSAMLVNNETGLRLPIEEIARQIRAKNPKVLFHVDAVQGYGKIEVNVKKLGCDLLTVSAHKIYGPKGAAALYVRKGVRLVPILFGGGQEKGFVSGTQNVPAIVGFATAAKEAMKNRNAFLERTAALCDYFLEKAKTFDFLQVNRDEKCHVPYILNLSFIDYVGENVLHFMAGRGIYISVGSACSSNTHHGSILSVLGASDKAAEGAVRVSFSKDTTGADIDAFFAAVEEVPRGLIKKYRR